MLSHIGGAMSDFDLILTGHALDPARPDDFRRGEHVGTARLGP